MWYSIQPKIHKRFPKPNNKDKLIQALPEERHSISQERIDHLKETMPNRTKFTVQIKGEATKY